MLILAGLCLTAGGCLERQMTITSQPEGALVYVSDVEVGRTSEHHKKGDVHRAEIHVRLPGKVVYVESSDRDLYVAINQARKEAEREIVDYKDSYDSQKKGQKA